MRIKILALYFVMVSIVLGTIFWLIILAIAHSELAIPVIYALGTGLIIGGLMVWVIRKTTYGPAKKQNTRVV